MEAATQEMAAPAADMAEPGGEIIIESEAVEEASAEPGDTTGQISQAAQVRPASKRLIIKNAELALEVEDTDVAINRSLGIVDEYRGYVISNRTWFNGEDKYATLAIGVPSDDFEEMLRRLKDLAVKVTNETASGQDVTDEYVDLESRLRSLEATAARIREFLADAKNVEQALQVSNRLSEVELEIEQVKGRMTYLKDRAAYSTITLQLNPKPGVVEPVVTLWSASNTFTVASTFLTKTATHLFQTSTDLVIWFTVVFLPCLIPFAGLLWLGSRMIRRFSPAKG
jgi:hypothetical protein